MARSREVKTALGGSRPLRDLEEEVAAARLRLRAAAGSVGVQPCVRRHPWAYLALAAGAGFVCGASPRMRHTAITTAIALLRRCAL